MTTEKKIDELLRKTFASGETAACRDNRVCQYNRVSNMLWRDYGVCSTAMSLIVVDILSRVASGETILAGGDRDAES